MNEICPACSAADPAADRIILQLRDDKVYGCPHRMTVAKQPPTDWPFIAQNAYKDAQIAELTGRAERAEKDLQIALSDLAGARDLINEMRTKSAGWQRAYETAVRERTEIRAAYDSRVNALRVADVNIRALRINLADANAHARNDAGEIANLKRLLGGHTCYAPEQRDAARESLRRLMATGQSIIDIAKNGMKGE